MKTTRGNLKPATLTNLQNNSVIHFMFNPEHYTVARTNTYETADNLVVPPPPEFKRFGRASLTLSTLYFDTYETGEDLTKITNELWDLMNPPDPGDPKSTPPEVKFEWSSFSFKAVVSDLTVKYTLFNKEGTPVRAEATISFIQSDDYHKHPHQNPTSGGGPALEVRRIVQGDRLDLIAADVYGDAARWRQIAEFNHIHNPKRLRPGQMITIPPK
jgi:hypothetical protein